MDKKQSPIQQVWISVMSWLVPVMVAGGLAFVTVAWADQRGYEPNALIALGLYMGYYTLVYLAMNGWRQRHEPEAALSHPARHWPVSGPVAKLGRKALNTLLQSSTLLTLLNPWLLVQQGRHILGQLSSRRRLSVAQRNPSHYLNAVNYRLPFNGEWLVYSGGLAVGTSHSWDILNQRFAYDFVVADAQYRRHQRSGARLRHYYAYGEPVLAAADGVVVRVKDGIGASPLVGYGFFDIWCRDFRGNHVVVRHADHEYGVYAHLQKKLSCRAGDSVIAGDRLGRCGHSGYSGEPHLQFHLQDGPDFYRALGLPVRFSNVIAEPPSVRPGELERGQRVRPSNS